MTRLLNFILTATYSVAFLIVVLDIFVWRS